MTERPAEFRDDDAPAATRRDADGEDVALPRGSDVTARSVTIARPRQEVFAFWRDLANLPRFMENIVRIDVRDDRHSHWVVKAPGGTTTSWDSRIIAEVPGKSLAWAADGDVRHSGQVEFRDAGARGTIVTATIAYDPPGGGIGKVVAKLFGREPAVQAAHDLRRLKQLLETGEISVAARNPALAAADED